MKDAGIVAVSDDGMPVMNAELMRRALEYARTFGLVVVQHAEDKQSGPGRRDERGPGGDARRLARAAGGGRVGHGGARPRAGGADRRALPRRAHLDSGVGAGGARGQAARPAGDLRGDAAPPDADRRRLLLATTRRPSARRRCARRPIAQALREALADGTIDCIATDHAPHASQEKEVEFEQAAFGMIGLETALGARAQAGRRQGADAADADSRGSPSARRACSGCPAGRWRKGAPADVTVIDLDAAYKVRSRALPLEVAQHAVRRLGAARAGDAHHRRRQASSTRSRGAMADLARLALEDGTVVRGRAFGARVRDEGGGGEVVFNTAITGYEEVRDRSVVPRADRHHDRARDRQRRLERRGLRVGAPVAAPASSCASCRRWCRAGARRRRWTTCSPRPACRASQASTRARLTQKLRDQGRAARPHHAAPVDKLSDAALVERVAAHARRSKGAIWCAR